MTPKQARLLAFIISYTDRTSASPSFDEMKDAMCLASKASVHRLLGPLQLQGWVERSRHHARDIRILKRPGQDSPYRVEALRAMSLDDFNALVRAAKIVIAERRASN